MINSVDPGQLTSIIQSKINRGSYMSAHVLLNLLSELGKKDKNVRLARAQLLDSIYQMTLALLLPSTSKNQYLSAKHVSKTPEY